MVYAELFLKQELWQMLNQVFLVLILLIGECLVKFLESLQNLLHELPLAVIIIDFSLFSRAVILCLKQILCLQLELLLGLWLCSSFLNATPCGGLPWRKDHLLVSSMPCYQRLD